MGQAILYCFRCSTQLREVHFEQGKAYRIDAWVCCATCAPEAIRSLPADRVQVLLKLIAAKQKPAPAPAPPPALRESRINMTPAPMQALKPASAGRMPLIIGTVITVVLLVVIGAVLSNRGEPPTARPETSIATPRPATPSPTPVAPASETAARTALRRAQTYAREHPEDLEGQLREFGDLALLADKAEAGAEARKAIDALHLRERDVADKGMAELNRDLSGPLERRDFAFALKSVDAARSKRTGAQWKFAVDKREREIRDLRDKAFGELKAKALEARARGNQGEVTTLRGQVLGWGERLAADFDQALAANTPPPPPPPPDPGPVRSAEGKVYLAAWESAMPRATARDYGAAAAELQKVGPALKEDASKQEFAQDLKDLQDLDRVSTALIAGQGASRSLSLRTSDGRALSGRVLTIDADRVELVVEPGKPTAFAEWSEVAAPTIAAWMRAQNIDARVIALFLLIEGDADAMRDGISPKFAAYAPGAAAKAPKPSADELKARETYYDAERQFRSMASRDKAIESYKLLKTKFKDTLLVRRAAARIDRRADAGREYYLTGMDLSCAGSFAPGRDGRFESLAESDPSQENRNWVEAEFLALPSAAYRCWILAGGCCGEAFTFHYQATGLTELNPKTKKRVPAEPGGDFAAPVKTTIKNLKPSHPKGEAKKPTRWEWIEIAVPRGAAGLKKLRFMTDQQGFAIGAVVVSSTRTKPPTEAEASELAKLRALDAVPAWAVDRPGNPARILLDDFEAEPVTWKWIGGWEFPGAKGGLSYDSTTPAHDGKGSIRVLADFTGGGGYVGGWRDLPPGRDLKEVRLWVKSSTAVRIMVRVVDASDQCHQKDLPLAPTKEWQELVLKSSEVTGGQHWGGPNDGKWHGVIKSFGVHLTKDSFVGTKSGEMWIDDVEGVLSVDSGDSER